MSLQKAQMTQTVKWVVKNQEKLNFNYSIQRRSVWKPEQKSLLIHSLIYGYPIPPFYALESDDNELYMLDGKQRMSTFIDFVEGKFALTELPKIEGINISGLTFEQLTEEFRDEILSTNLNIYRFKNITDEEIENLFFRLNNGTPLSKIELTRSIAGTEIMNFVNKVSSEPFFKESIAITESGRNRFIDQELILQITALVINNSEPISFSGNDIREFALTLKEEGIPEDKQNIILNTAKYLSEAFPERQKFLKKVHIPIVFVNAIKSQIQGVTPEQFAEWVKLFLTSYKVGDEYGSACSTKTASKENVGIRLQVMGEAFDRQFPSNVEQEIAITE